MSVKVKVVLLCCMNSVFIGESLSSYLHTTPRYCWSKLGSEREIDHGQLPDPLTVCSRNTIWKFNGQLFYG